MGYFNYRIALSPSWLLGPNGQTISWSLGTEEDDIVNDAKTGVLERLPDYAGLDSPGVSQALSYIGFDRNLVPVYGDDDNLDATRLYFKSGFSIDEGAGTLAAGVTLPWFPNTDYVVGTQIGAGGYVWTCMVGGLSGLSNPFPVNQLSSQQLGQVIVDGEVTWTLATVGGQPLAIATVPSPQSPTYQVLGPPGPTGQSNYQTVSGAVAGVPGAQVFAPGWYWAGTSEGLIDAMVSAGLCGIDSGGNLVPPQIYTNAEWLIQNATNDQIGFSGALSLAAPAVLSINSTITGSGTAGTSGTVMIVPTSGAPDWAGTTDYATGSFVTSPHGDVYWAAQGGESGPTNPFPASTPSPSVWPPTSAEGIADGSVVWLLATFSPIPSVVPIGGSWGMTFEGTFTTGGPYTNTWTNIPPDGNSAKWARVWIAIPVSQHFGSPFLWGDGSSPPGQYQGDWGGPPFGYPFVPFWGQGSNVNLYGLIQSLANRWLPAHVQLMGVWLTQTLDTMIDTDSISGVPWNPALVTFGGQITTYFKYN